MISSLKVEQRESIVEIRPNRKINLFKHIVNGESCDTTIFLIHGSMAVWNQFEAMIAHLKDKFPVNLVAWDAYGCGKSDRPRDWDDYGSLLGHYSTDELFQDAVEIFNVYGRKRNVLIGHSYGTAMVARLSRYWQTSLSNDKSISGAVLLGTAWKMNDGGHPIFMLPEAILECLKTTLSEEFMKNAFSPSCSEEIKKDYKTLSIPNDIHVAKAFYTQFKWATAEDWYSLKEFPVLMLHGKDDKIATEENALQLYEKLQLSCSEMTSGKDNADNISLDNASCDVVSALITSFKIIDDAGHMIHLEKTDVINGHVEDFLIELLLI